MTEPNFLDVNRPNAGRIYDYLLGGHHNFEADRQAADQVVRLVPYLPKAMRMQRWCLQDLAVELTEKRGYDVLIDFASGLPTNDHLHTVVPAGTTVIYSDYDPLTVEFAQNILQKRPDVYYLLADARQPEDLLTRPDVQEILKGRRDVALIYWGVGLFLSDADISHVAKYLAEWAGPRSCWAFCIQLAIANPEGPAMTNAEKMYERMGSKLYFRSLEKYLELFQPWHADARGLISFLDWHGLDRATQSLEELRAVGPSGGGHVAFLVK